MRRLVLAAVVVAAASLGACRGGQDERRSVLDGSPRRADAQGIVAEVDREGVVLLGQPRRPVRDDLQAFRVLDGAGQPLLGTKGHFVQVGLRGDRIAWLGTFGFPGGDPPRVRHTGTVASSDGATATFAGGLVVRLTHGVQLPAGRRAEVAIDPSTGLVASALLY